MMEYFSFSLIHLTQPQKLLFDAAKNGKIGVIDHVLDKSGLDPDVTYDGNTPFMAACKNKQLR